MFHKKLKKKQMIINKTIYKNKINKKWNKKNKNMQKKYNKNHNKQLQIFNKNKNKKNLY